MILAVLLVAFVVLWLAAGTRRTLSSLKVLAAFLGLGLGSVALVRQTGPFLDAARDTVRTLAELDATSLEGLAVLLVLLPALALAASRPGEVAYAGTVATALMAGLVLATATALGVLELGRWAAEQLAPGWVAEQRTPSGAGWTADPANFVPGALWWVAIGTLAVAAVALSIAAIAWVVGPKGWGTARGQGGSRFGRAWAARWSWGAMLTTLAGVQLLVAVALGARWLAIRALTEAPDASTLAALALPSGASPWLLVPGAAVGATALTLAGRRSYGIFAGLVAAAAIAGGLLVVAALAVGLFEMNRVALDELGDPVRAGVSDIGAAVLRPNELAFAALIALVALLGLRGVGFARLAGAYAGRTYDAAKPRCWHSRTPFQRHLDFFDADRNGIMTPLETYRRLKQLRICFTVAGVDLYYVTALLLNMAIGRRTWQLPRPLYTFTVNIDAAHLIRGNPHTQVWRPAGTIDDEKLQEIFRTWDGDYDRNLERTEMDEIRRTLARSAGGAYGRFKATLTTRAELPALFNMIRSRNLQIGGPQAGIHDQISQDDLRSFYSGEWMYLQVGEQPPLECLCADRAHVAPAKP